MLRAVFIIMFAWTTSLQAQLKYLKNDPAMTFGAHVGVASHDGTKTRAFTGSFVPLDFLEVGMTYGNARDVFDPQNGKQEARFFSPYLEFVAAHKDGQPFSMSLNLSYVSYFKKEVDNKLITAAFSAFRDFPVGSGYRIYPEAGVSKSVGTESGNIKPLFFIATGVVGQLGNQFQLILTPHIGIQKGKSAWGVTLSLAVLR